MKGFFIKNRIYLYYQLGLFFFTVVVCLSLVPVESISSVNLILLVTTLVLCIIGMLCGLLVGLGSALLALFLFGSLLVFSDFFSLPFQLSVKEIILWMMAFIAAASLTGLLHRVLTGILEENREMKQKFADFVTIDEWTGFDNEKRFYYDMEEEFNRSRRTGVPFSLLIVEILYYDQYLVLYGEKETAHLMKEMAEKLRSKTRITDRKFRIGDGSFAILLCNCNAENGELVIRKVEQLLKRHTLETKRKQVELTISFGLAEYREEYSEYMEMVEHARKELNDYVQ
ncbi:GGDEF domain-containing protein [Brevibacillus fulvus]|uniref:Diguanylate cyclase (GGDEF)-like protein n=1 Tax=Brevibacillus fulvus TaxID=1125967 RepID=A0A938Y2Y8_9BACL|nr:GGDEF domain-containing protein [Brevibacillus fulvus]MBM7591404.1 diguanylate cyclase (GGDEF)-like protein [Brevibacillus fulvus]